MGRKGDRGRPPLQTKSSGPAGQWETDASCSVMRSMGQYHLGRQDLCASIPHHTCESSDYVKPLLADLPELSSSHARMLRFGGFGSGLLLQASNLCAHPAILLPNASFEEVIRPLALRARAIRGGRRGDFAHSTRTHSFVAPKALAILVGSWQPAEAPLCCSGKGQ